MHTRTARTSVLAVCTLFILAAIAPKSQAESLERLRTASPRLRAVLAAALDRSPTLQSLVQRIAASNVIVYMTCERFTSVRLNGQTMWADGNSEARYLRVQVDCFLTQSHLVAILGHELQHVAEVADTQEVVDSDSFGRLFHRIGYRTCSGRGAEQFETDRAIATGERVRQEVLYRWPIGARVVADDGRRVPAQ